ncbi:hypothetical protein LCGC14_1382430 [marine sediment metagenome]|uniref:Uncharacterized protein n=1 Tax=marine sediment metagenome TaxID=412755 RepID=A0A0F9KN35_9ZZZZ
MTEKIGDRRQPDVEHYRRGEMTPKRVPLDLPEAKTGKPRTPGNQRYMRDVIRSRQNVEVDFLELMRIPYDWSNELIKRWMPGTGNYNPQKEYERKKLREEKKEINND